MGLLQTFLNGLLRVMSDGGPSWAFFQSDAEVFEENLPTLKEFIYICIYIVEQRIRLKQVLELYRSETKVVIQNFKHASEQVGTPYTLQRTTKQAYGDVDILLRVLCHKTDREVLKIP
jgi:hypothetical protein